MQFYGPSLWLNTQKNKRLIKEFSIGYHKALKKILNVPYFYRNHLVCEFLGLVTLEHQLNIERIRFIYKIFQNPPIFLKKNYNYFRQSSYFFYDVSFIIKKIYDIDDLLDNDLDAILARVIYVHNRYNDQFYLEPD